MRPPPDPQTKVVKRKPRVVKVNRGQSNVQDFPNPKPVVVKAAGPPNFPTKIPVRPGAPVNRYKSEPTTQAQRSHVHVSRVRRNRELAQAQAQHDVLTAQDIAKRDAYLAAHPEILHPPKPQKDAGLLATALNVASKAAPFAAGVVAGPVSVSGNALVDKLTGAKILPTAKKIAENAPIDAAELAVTTPSSVAKLASTAVHHPEKVPGMLAEPYKQLAAHPGKFITEHPVTTALMVDPAVRMPGRALGKVARVTGKQTLERPAATLPGTALRDQRVGSRDVVVRAKQARTDRKQGAPVMNDRQVRRRVDEFYGAGQKHVQRAQQAAVRQVKARGLKGPDAEQHVSGAVAGARAQLDQRFAEEFGSTWVNQARAPAVRIRKVGEQKITVAHKVPPKEEYIAGRPKPARGTPDPTVEALSENIKPGKPGIAIESEHVRMVDPVTRAPVGFGRELPGSKVVVARDAQGKPIGVLKMILDQHDKPTVMEVAVDPAHRGKGIATSLVRTAHEAGFNVAAAAREGGLTEAGAALVHKNLAARAVDQPAATLRVGRYETAVTPRKGIVTLKKSGTKGVLHDNKADADAIAARVPFDAKVKPVGEKYAVVPTVAAKRLAHHEGVGTTKALPARIMRVSRRQFTQTVLPFSPKWLTGQAVEAGLRSLISGAGPTSYLRANKLVKELERQQPGAGQGLLERAAPGGLIGRTAAQEMSGKTLADEFAGTSLANVAHALTKAGTKPGPKQVRGLFHHVTGFVFNTLNGKIIEGTAQRAMLGKALKDSPLMERSILGLSDRAIADAAKGLHGTESQVQLGRAVQRMYGKYANFGPELRSFVQHWTPFLPWYLNVARFLTKTLPVDHPITTALLADIDAATEDWRKAAGLSLHGKHKPSYLLGGYPAGPDQVVRLGRYTPFGGGQDVSGSLIGLVLPQFDSAQMALRGLDWTGKPLNGKFGPDASQAQKFITAANDLIESMIPGVGQAERVTGVEAKYVRRQKDQPTVLEGKNLAAALRKEVDPFMATGTPKSTSSPGVRVRVPPPDILKGPVVRVKPLRVPPPPDILK